MADQSTESQISDVAMLRACSSAVLGVRGLLPRDSLGPTLEALSSLHAVLETSDESPSTSYSGSGSVTTAFRRYASSVTASANQSKEYISIVNQWKSIDAKLRKESSSNGLIRLTLSSDKLPQPIPQHVIEPGLHTVDVQVRGEGGSGSTFCKWLRRAGRTPVRVQSLWPGNKALLLHMDKSDAEKLLRMYGRHGCEARVIALRVVAPSGGAVLGTVRVKPQRVIMTSNSNVVEALDTLYCPQDRIVQVDVPVKLINDDVAPGVKKGGWLHVQNRTVRYQALGSSIPPFIEVDVGKLDVNQDIRVRQLPVPAGTRLPVQNYEAFVVRCTTNAGND